MNTGREPQAESWWKERNCPLWAGMAKYIVQQDISNGYRPYACEASNCAFWRQTSPATDTEERRGICTKA